MRTTLTLALLCGFSHFALAQNLLTNGDFSNGNTGFTTGYSFVSSGQSTQVGSYGIRTLSTDFNPGYSSFGDHTSGSGNMMLIDGAQNASTVVWSETVPVAANTNYVFAGWAASSDPSSPARLNISVNGTVVVTNLTLGATGGAWQRIALAWNSGAATSAQIAITDQNTDSGGNDFALDDLSFGVNEAAPVMASIFTAVEIDWNSQLNVDYQVQYATSLNTNSWQNLGNPVTGTGGTMAAFDSTRANPERIYRIQTLP